MPEKSYLCRTLSPDGRVVSETQKADSIEILEAKLKAKGMMVLELREQNKLEETVKQVYLFREKITPSDISLLSKEFAVLIKAGLPMPTCLSILHEHSAKKRIKKALSNTKKEIEGGASLSDSLAKSPDIFSPFYCTTVRSGEATDNMVLVFNNLSQYYKTSAILKKKVFSALIYPVFLLALAIFAVIYLLTFVVPVFAKLYADLGQNLPMLTKSVIYMSDTIRDYFPFLVLTIAIAWYLGFIRFRKQCSAFLDRLIVKIPVLKDIIIQSFIARFCRTVSMLIRSGAPLTKAIETASETADNSVISAKILEAKDHLAAGNSFSISMKNTGFAPPLAVEMIHTGEQTGALDEMLDNIGEIYEENVDAAVSAFLVVIEPLMMLVMGIFIAFILLSMYMPIFELSAKF